MIPVSATPTAAALTRNALLAPCGPDFAAGLTRVGARTTYEPGAAPWRPGETILFPESGMISLRTLAADGCELEVAVVSSDGAVGLLQAFGGGTSQVEARVLTRTVAWTVSAAAFPALALGDEAVMTRIWAYLGAREAEAYAALACVRTHGARERLADTLLAYQRRQGDDRLPLTQETLSTSIGVCRTTVTALMMDLGAAQAIRTGRGWFAVADEDRLAAAACGCRSAGPPQPADLLKAPKVTSPETPAKVRVFPQ